jgi:ABC-2 type transport system permease protein
MAKYTAYTTGGASSQALKDLPDTLKAVLGIGSFDVTTAAGFFAFLFMYLEIAAAIHAVLLGSGIIAKEERDKTTEFLNVKPVSRSAVITSKFLAALVNVVVLNIVTLISSIIMVSAYNKGDDITGIIVVFFVSLLIVQLIFLSLGALLSASLRNSKASGSLSVGILLVSFMIYEITGVAKNLGALNIFSPFKYFNGNRIIEGSGLDMGILALSLLLVAAFTTATYFYYRKRDMRV